MKNKKTKILSVIFIGLFCIIMGFPFVNGERQTRTLTPNQYWGLGTYLETGDTLNFRIESDPASINIYIMNQAQIDYYIDNPQDDATLYIRRWIGYYLLTDSFVAPDSQIYYILMINPSDSTSTYVIIDATVDEYVPPIPKTITITNPTSTDTFDVGEVYITWTSTGDINYVIVELYCNGVFLETINYQTGNGGSYYWYIYNNDYTDGSNYQIKITDYDDNSIYDYSSYFTIEVESEEPEPYDPYDPYAYNIWNTINNILFIVIPIVAIILVITIPIWLIKKHKRKTREEDTIIRKEETLNKSYCPECGVEILDITKEYCSQCGNKIIFK